MITVRIAAIDEHMVSTETPHVGVPHGLVVEHKVRVGPGHPRKLAPNPGPGNPLEVAPRCQGTQAGRLSHAGQPVASTGCWGVQPCNYYFAFAFSPISTRRWMVSNRLGISSCRAARLKQSLQRALHYASIFSNVICGHDNRFSRCWLSYASCLIRADQTHNGGK